MAGIGFVIGLNRDKDLEERIARDEAPMPEYLMFSQDYDAEIYSYIEVIARNPKFAEIVKRRNLSSWGPAVSLGLQDRSYQHILASCEDVGLPIALDRRLNGHGPDVSIITHGFIHREVEIMRALRGVEGIQYLCLSESIRQMMLNRFALDEHAVVNTSSGIDLQFYRPLRQPDEPFYIATAGIAHRDYRTLIEAVRDLPIKLKIAPGSAWSSQSTDLGDDDLPSNVEIVTLSRKGVRDLYAGALCVVVPLYPAFFACGYAVISEAMAMGKAVIVTRTYTPSDFMAEDETTGYYVSPGDVNALRDRIALFLQKPELALEMGSNARLRLERYFSQEAYCRRLHDAVMEFSPRSTVGIAANF